MPPIEILPYDPAWADQFTELRAVLLGNLSGLAADVQHLGSTAVPGLAAKPILDITVIIATRDTLPATIDRLGEIGYQHQGDLGIAGREAFRNLGRDVPRDGSGREWPVHYLYVCAADNREYRRQRAVRDFLRHHPEETAAYAALKQELAVQFAADRNGYSNAKTDFIVSILRQAAPDLVS